MTSDVEAAIQELQHAFPGHKVEVVAEPQGGAQVIVHDLPIGNQYVPSTTWVGFNLTFQYPRGDVYPHYIDSGVRRVDGQGHVPPFHVNYTFLNRPAIMVSRRTPGWNSATDSAALKLAKVLQWIQQQ